MRRVASFNALATPPEEPLMAIVNVRLEIHLFDFPRREG
jgi:hypothetical protein